MVVIREGKPSWDPVGSRERIRGAIWCDPCIEPLVRALNTNGLQTVASCCGHGDVLGTVCLSDDRVLVVAENLDQAKSLVRTFENEQENTPEP
jgi:hypothetical protein